MKVLVLGGAGFVGQHLIVELHQQGHTVAVYDKVYGDDLFDAVALRLALHGQDVVYHFAASATPHSGKTEPTRDLEQNLLGTARVLEGMRQMQVPRIVFASSSAVYGDTTCFPTPEDAPIPNQTSLYGASKLAAEALISAYTRTFDMQSTTFRFAPMLGEGYRRGHVRDFWVKLKTDPTKIEVLGDGRQRRSYVYVKDAIDAVLSTQACGTFNVSGNDTASVNESLNWICDEMGARPQRVYTGSSWAGDKALTLLDTSRLRKYGWSPHVSIEEAVRRTVRSFA